MSYIQNLHALATQETLKNHERNQFVRKIFARFILTFKDLQRISFTNLRKDLIWNITFQRILNGIDIFARTLKVFLQMMNLLWSSLKVFRRFLQEFHFGKSRVLILPCPKEIISAMVLRGFSNFEKRVFGSVSIFIIFNGGISRLGLKIYILRAFFIYSIFNFWSLKFLKKIVFFFKRKLFFF